MKAWILKPLTTKCEESIRERVDVNDPEFIKARMKVEWKHGDLWVHHPNFKWVVGRRMRDEALDNARTQAIGMLPEFLIDEDFEVKIV